MSRCVQTLTGNVHFAYSPVISRELPNVPVLQDQVQTNMSNYLLYRFSSNAGAEIMSHTVGKRMNINFTSSSHCFVMFLEHPVMLL